MPPQQDDQTTHQPLFRTESLVAAKDASIAESRITRPWAVSAIAAACLPLLAILVTVLLTYTYKQPQYVDGIIGKQDQAKCTANQRSELVGVVRIDELSLVHVRTNADLLVLVPAVSDKPVIARVMCVSDDAASLGSKTAPAQYDVVIALSAFEGIPLSQKMRAGMTLRAQTGYTDLRLLSLFTKDRNNGR